MFFCGFIVFLYFYVQDQKKRIFWWIQENEIKNRSEYVFEYFYKKFLKIVFTKHFYLDTFIQNLNKTCGYDAKHGRL